MAPEPPRFRSEARNLTNRTNLHLPNVNAVNGGVIAGAAAARVLQFGLCGISFSGGYSAAKCTRRLRCQQSSV